MKILLAFPLVLMLVGCAGLGKLNPKEIAACADAYSVCMASINRVDEQQDLGTHTMGMYDEQGIDIEESVAIPGVPINVNIDIGELLREGASLARDANQQCILIFTETSCEMRIE